MEGRVRVLHSFTHPQVQQLLYLMQSSIVSEAIEGIIQARPGATRVKDGALTVPGTKESKRLSMKRQSMQVPEGGGEGEGGMGGGRCNCGRCCRCVPTPAGE